MIDAQSVLINHLMTVVNAGAITDITRAEVAHSNIEFDSDGKTAFIEVSYLPATSATDTKDTTGEKLRGIFQINVYVPRYDKTGGFDRYDTRASQIITDLMSQFQLNQTLTHNGQNVYVSDRSFQSIDSLDGWHVKPLSINWRT